MTAKFDTDHLTRIADVHPARAERTFGLHPALFAVTIGAYFVYLAIMGAAFMNAELWIPFAVFAVFVAAAFGVPAMWARIAGPRDARFADWSEFMAEGLETATGHLGGGAVVAQVLTVPLLIVAWGIAIAAIRATV